MTNTLTVERVHKIFNDATGDYIYVGPDSDGLDAVELVSVLRDETTEARFFMTVEQAVLVANSILELYGPKSN